MTNRFNAANSLLRADPRPLASALPVQSTQATAGGLIRSTLIAAASAGAILVLFWLPAEYGIDPTGVGGLTGLTAMGEIKQQLSAEAEADALAVTPQQSFAPEIIARLDKIDAQLAAISAVIGTPPIQNAADASIIAAPVVDAATPEWRDEVSYTLNPGEGIEVKLAMDAGQIARFFWTANGNVVNFDLHGDGGGQNISYEQGRAVSEQAGELTAAFTGNHGWFWRNRTDTAVTVTLRTGGDYGALKAP